MAYKANMLMGKMSISVLVIFQIISTWGLTFSQSPPNPQPPASTKPMPGMGKPIKETDPPPVKKLSDNLVQIGNIIVNTQKKELTVSGKILPTKIGSSSSSGVDPEPDSKQPPASSVSPTPPEESKILEYLATSRNGGKSYESAIELNTDATTFNFALIMIGLEKSHAVLPKTHFDRDQVKGDPVEIWVEWDKHKIRAEEMLYDQRTKTVPKMGEWVYTGSVVLPDGRYLAEMDGCLIGFVHDPDTIIENSIGGGLNAYGSIQLNPNLKLTANTAVKITVKALQKEKKTAE
jgi:hypothetical protein